MKNITLLLLSFCFYTALFAQKYETLTDEIWDNGTWQNWYKYTYTYDANCDYESFLKQGGVTNSTNWLNDFQHFFQTDSRGNVSQSTIQSWDTLNNAWGQISNAYRYTYTYSTTDKIEEQIYETYSSGNWLNNQKYLSTYDSKDSLTNYFIQSWDTQLNSWVNYLQYQYTYNTNGILEQLIYQNWDTQLNSWVNYLQYLYTYNANSKKSEETLKVWTNNAWVLNSRYTYSYDGQGYLVNLLTQGWDNNSNAWVNSTKIDYSNNSDGGVNQNTSQIWNHQSNLWLNSQKTTYTYSPCVTTGITDADENNNSISLYPNPATSGITINMEDENISLLLLCDLNGKVISTIPCFRQTTIQVNISHLPKGLYLVKAQNENGYNSTKKLLKQ